MLNTREFVEPGHYPWSAHRDAEHWDDLSCGNVPITGMYRIRDNYVLFHLYGFGDDAGRTEWAFLLLTEGMFNLIDNLHLPSEDNLQKWVQENILNQPGVIFYAAQGCVLTEEVVNPYS